MSATEKESITTVDCCPLCGTKTPPVGDQITANDGGSIFCRGCGKLYHKCLEGRYRAGYSPLSCPHCCTIKGRCPCCNTACFGTGGDGSVVCQCGQFYYV